MKIKPRVYTDSLKCLWRWSCWFCKYFCCWLGRCCCFNHLHGGEHTLALIQQPASCLFGCLTPTSSGTSLPLSFETLLCFLVCFFSPRRLFSWSFRASWPSWSLRSCSLSVRCSVSHREVLFVFFHAASEDGVVACTRKILCLLVHSGTFLFQENFARGKLYSQKVQSHWNRSVHMRTACGSSWTLNHPKSRWRHA